MSNIEKVKAEIERRMLELARDKYIDLHDTLCRTKELNLLLAFIDSLPEEKPSEDLEVAAEKFARSYDQGTCDGIIQDGFIAGAKWMNNHMPMPEDTVIFQKGVAEGRRLEREEREENKRKEDELPRFYGD